jgi:hypothetical protein
MRIWGTMPLRGGVQWVSLIRSSADVSVEAIGSWGGAFIVTESGKRQRVPIALFDDASAGKFSRKDGTSTELRARPQNCAEE